MVKAFSGYEKTMLGLREDEDEELKKDGAEIVKGGRLEVTEEQIKGAKKKSREDLAFRDFFRDFKKVVHIRGYSTIIRGMVETDREKLSLEYSLQMRQGGETTRIIEKRFVVARGVATQVKQSAVALANKGYSVDAIAKELNLKEERS